MTAAQVLLLILYALGMVGGQMLFKVAASAARFDSVGALAATVLSPTFIAAIALYAGLSAMWVWLLTFTPLSRAYPFVALAFVITPVAAALIFHEPISLRLAIGVALIAVGVALVAS